MPYVYEPGSTGATIHVGSVGHKAACGRSVPLHWNETPIPVPRRDLCAECVEAAVMRAARGPDIGRSRELRTAVLVALLAEGLTIAAIARLLNKGRRTVSHWSGEAMKREGVESHFAWGFACGMRAGYAKAVAERCGAARART